MLLVSSEKEIQSHNWRNRASTIFDSRSGKLQRVMDYKALILIPKHNEAPRLQLEMFVQLGITQFLIKLDLKTEFYYIRIFSNDVKEKVFKGKTDLLDFG